MGPTILPIGESSITVKWQTGSFHRTATARVVATKVLLGHAPALLPVPIASFTVKWEGCGHNEGGKMNFLGGGSDFGTWPKHEEEYHGDGDKEARNDKAPVVATSVSQ